METPNELSKRAEDEATIIKLIFGQEVVHCKSRDCWKQFHNLELRVRLGSTTSDKDAASIELDFNCPPTYPLDPPKITILKPIGLRVNEVFELNELLNTRIRQIAGAELIYDICVEAQNYLRSKRESTESNEQTVSRPSTTHLQPSNVNRNPARQNSVDSRQSVVLAKDEEPIEVRVEDELRCRREKWLQRIGPLGDGIKVELISKPGQLVEINRVMNSTVKRKHEYATEYYACDQQRVILVSEYKFQHKLTKRDKNLIAKLSTFEKSLRTFSSHVLNNNLVPIDDEFLTTFAFLHVHRASNSPHLFDTRLLVGQYIDLDSQTLSVDGVLQNLLKTSKDTLLPQIANHLICGLKTLHEFRVAHGDLNLNTIWIRSDKTFFMSDHHLCSDILHFCHSFGHITEESVRRRRVSVHSLRLRDLKSLGSVLMEINQRDKSSFTNQECLKDFVSQCNLSQAHVQNLSNHWFLYLSFPASPKNEDGSTSFTSNPTAALKQSGRLLKEYHVINYIGRGGFGEVFLARNKLDGNNYAIKRIPLTDVPWKQIERIKNEVALCSKITDVNIVRYFSSWLETITLDANETDVSSESISQAISDDQSLLPSKLRNLSDQFPSYAKDKQKPIDNTNTSESSDDSGPGFFHAPKTQQKKPTTLVNMSHGSDLSVVFAGDDKNDGNVFGLSDLSEEQSTEKSQSKSELSLTYLCLQMEYCKHETLRKLIDDNELFDNAAMTWRIFKEILLGLKCMHSYSLIHRDVKPSNIFLDSNWVVKIGDFGLATRALFHSDDDSAVVNNPNSSNALQPSMTKNIGTTLYIAPEAKENERKVYNTKFDIYSLGIVLFEMLLKPPATRIERIQILEKLRDEMVIPSETFDNLPSSHRQSAEKLLKWCLQRDPLERPTATELLESGLIPVIESEENKFIQIFRTKQKLRPLLLHELFNTPLQPTLGNNYDRKFCTESMNRPFPLDTIKVLSDLLRLNGYDFLHNQELVPCLQNFSFEGLNSTLLSSLCESYKVMESHNGTILQLPTTFRYGFARFCAHRGITRLKACSIGRVYSQSSTLNNHPESRYELEVDIIAPHEFNTQISIDLLELVVEIFKKLHLPDLKWKLVINHRSLLKAVCLHYGLVDEFTQNNFLNLLYEFSSQTRKDSYSNLLFGLTHQCGMSEKVAHDMCILLNLPVSTPHQLRERLRSLLRSKHEQVRENAERALAEYDSIFHNLSHKLPAQLNMSFFPIFCYQPLIFSDGLLFSMRVEFCDSKGKTTWIPLLSGGQYDKFLALNRQINASSLLESNCSAFGFNFAIANAADLQFFLNKSKKKLTSSLVLVACSSLDYFAAAASMANQLREYEIPTDLWQEELNFSIGGTLLEYCLERPVHFILQFVNLDNICIYQNERFEDSNAANEFRIIQNRATVSETLKHFALQVRSTKDEKDGVSSKSTDGSGVDRADLKNLPMTASMQNVNLKTCSTRSSKLAHHTRKKYESHAFAVLNPLLKRFSSKCHIDALITDLPLEVLSAIANIDRTRGHDHTFTEFQLLAKQHPKVKSDIFLLFDEMETFIEQQNNSNKLLILLSPGIDDSFYRLLL